MKKTQINSNWRY